MKNIHALLLFATFGLLFSASGIAQNSDSVKAYILEFIEPEVNIVVSYGSPDIIPQYVKQEPQNEKTEAFIEKIKKEYETTKNPMNLLQIGQTYIRMNQREKATHWMYRAESELEMAIEMHPDSIELVESAVLLYMELGNFDKAIESTEKVYEHYQSSDPLFMKALLCSFSGQFEKGLETSIKAMKLFPEEGKWFIARILNESQLKMQKLDFGSDEYGLSENRIDRSYLAEAYKKYPNSTEIELMSVFGDFLLFAYDELYPNMFKRFATMDDFENFTFGFDEDISAQLDDFHARVTKLSKKKEYKNWHPIHYTLGTIHLFKSEYKKAIPYFEKAINLMKPHYRNSDNNVNNSYNNLISIYTILEDYESAEKLTIQRATEEINIDPQADHYISMALYRIIDNDKHAGLKLLDQAIGIDSTAIDAYTYKAFVAMLNNELDEALVLLEVPQSVNPDDLLSYKAIIFYSLLTKNRSFTEDLINRLEAYDSTDRFIKEARRLLKTE